MTSTITPAQQQNIADLLSRMTLPAGLGTKEAACSIAAINLALTGKLTDTVPGCMSLVIGRWVIGVQDAMPADMRNSAEWKRLLPLAAGTGRDKEQERLAIILDWMWSAVLPTLQPYADSHGFGAGWRAMLAEKTQRAAKEAAWAAAKEEEAAWAAAEAAWAAAWSAWSAAAEAAAKAAAKAAEAAWAAAWAAAKEEEEAAWAEEAEAAAWSAFDPCAVLSRLVAVR